MEQTDPGLPQFETFLSEVETFYAHKKSLWFGITGSWRKGSEEVEKNVRGTIQRIMKAGYGIVSGGALGVDYIATDEALKLNPQADKIQIFLPVSLEVYKAHYRKRAEEGVITFEQAEALISQLQNLVQKRAQALIENLHYTR